MDAVEAAEDVVNRSRVTHVLFVHIDSFMGSIVPLRSILQKVRKVRNDVSICIDNRLSYNLHPISTISSIVDYSVYCFPSFLVDSRYIDHGSQAFIWLLCVS